MPANLIVGYGREDRQGKRDPKQQKVTDEAEEEGSQVMTPVEGTKKRRDSVRDYLNGFIQDAEEALDDVRIWREKHPDTNPRRYSRYDPTLPGRLQAAKQLKMNMQMTGRVPGDQVLAHISSADLWRT